MNISVSYDHFNGTSYDTYDVSDYIIECDLLPLYERNINYTAVISTFNMKLSVLAPFVPGIGDRVYFNIDGVYTLSHGVTEAENRTHSSGKNIDDFYNITLLNRLSLLKNANVVYSYSFDQWIQASATAENYYDNPINAFNNVQITWLLQKIFSAQGLSLNIDEAYAQSFGNYPAYGGTYEVFGKHFCIDKNVYYGLNQSYSEAFDNIAAGDKTWYDNLITLFDFVSNTCAVFEWLIYPSTAEDSYKLVVAGTTPSIPDSYVYYYSNTIKKNDDNGIIGYKYSAYPAYYSTTLTTLVNSPYADVNPDGTFINSLVYLIRDTRAGAASGSIGTTGESEYVGINLEYTGIANHNSLKNCYYQTASAFHHDITEIDTYIYTGSYDFKSNLIDLENKISKLTYVELTEDL